MGAAKRAMSLARVFSGMVRKLDPDDWKPIALHPVEGLFDFEGPGGMILIVSANGRYSTQVPTA